MAAEAGAGGERAFEIDEVAGLFFAEIRALESFAGKIGGEMGLVKFGDGRAAALYGNAVTEFHAVRDGGIGTRRRRDVNAQNAAAGVEVQRFDPADLLGDSGKHGS